MGHDPQSVWPGVDGAAVFLAHDVSYFVHLNELKPGDVITYATACNTVTFQVSGQQVVPAGSPVANSTGPSLVLDTCWPPNALFFTPDRLLIRATEVGAATKGANLDPGAQFIQTVQSTDYTTSAPAGAAGPGAHPRAERGADGDHAAWSTRPWPSPSRPGPLSLEAAALETYFGGLHAARAAPAGLVAGHGPDRGHAAAAGRGDVTGHDAPLDVEIDSAGGTPTQVVLRTTVTLQGGSAPGQHAMTVVLPVHGAVVTIGSWAFT